MKADVTIYLPGVIAIGAWLMLEPYIVWQTNVFQVVFMGFACVIWAAGVLYKGSEWKRLDLVSFFLLLLFIFYYYRPGLNNGLNYSGFLIVLFSLSVFFAMTYDLKRKTFYYFRLVFVWSLVPGMFVWFVYAAGIPIDWMVIGELTGEQVLNPQKALMGIGYVVLPGSVILDYWLDSGFPLYQLCAMYDEPGVVGTIAALLLVSDKVDLSKRVNQVLFLAGVITFSLAFFLMLIIYALMNINKPVLIFIGWGVTLGFIGLLVMPAEYYEQFSSLVIGRLDMSTGSMAGDNRETELLHAYWDRWLNTDIFNLLLGLATVVSGDVGSSWKSIVILKGLLGIVGLFLLFSTLLLRYYAGYASICFSVIFIASVYQRPMVLVLPLIVIFVGGLINLQTKYKLHH